ncbi:HAD hydrolase family protein [uncultured Tateyamaria sp.]|uniref:HAD hydrolase family protein n=1 Tax=uncultured Tateyamaria sp. TaxID=455651 RepID=UPI002638FD26|nr:HAD hydrolase family protein [uncultured Tateyamaria sp.]
MAKPYASEMAQLGTTLDWICQSDITGLKNSLRTACSLPMVAIGSGGSLSAAHGLASNHRQFSQKISVVSTPLEITREPIEKQSTNWLLSAGGQNVDVLAAVSALIAREPSHLVVMTGRDDTKLTEICRAHPFVDLHIFPPPAGKDGFLATNSLFGFSGLIQRAYTLLFQNEKTWNDTADAIRRTIGASVDGPGRMKVMSEPLWQRSTTVVLYGPATSLGAIDLESKFTEAALGSIQLADFRNFAHGRHHWLAKRGNDSGVIALVAPEDRKLAEKTLALLPDDIPQVVIDLPGGGSAGLASLLAAFELTGLAGIAQGIDPGRPGVPMFGRHLYRLKPPREKAEKPRHGLSQRDVVAIERKSANSIECLEKAGKISFWEQNLNQFRDAILSEHFDAIVLDYDGTVVETRARKAPPNKRLTQKLVECLKADIWVCFATGRGKSVRTALQDVIPEQYWEKVLIGYYNGAEIGSLKDDLIPDGNPQVGNALHKAAELLRTDEELTGICEQEDRTYQITVSCKNNVDSTYLFHRVTELLAREDCNDVSVVRSGHSIDVLSPMVSKNNVAQALRKNNSSVSILSIGDSGGLNGNDHDLLAGPFSLSVDKISSNPATCWNLGSRGQRGPEILAEYLDAIECNDGTFRFRKGALK